MDAIEIAKKLREYIWSAMEVVDNHKDRPEVVREGKERMEVLDQAVQIVNKQIPKKIESDSSCKNVCPSCGGAVHKALRTEIYCQYCGQLIDWKGR